MLRTLNSSLICLFGLLVALLIVMMPSVSKGQQIVVSKSEGDCRDNKTSLKCQWIALNDTTCPMMIKDFKTNYDGYARASAIATATNALTAYEVNFLLFDAFGGFLAILTTEAVQDISKGESIKVGSEADRSFWTISESSGRMLCASVAYVAHVRTIDGKVWTYDKSIIAESLRQAGLTPKMDAGKD